MLGLIAPAVQAAKAPTKGIASWYGEAHRGKLMANGKKFNPDRLTAASWFYPLGTKVEVSMKTPAGYTRRVHVTITDRGPAHYLVREGRIIDLAHAAFKRLAHPDLGLVPISVRVIQLADS
jgi:rare lipoprotein A